MSSENSTPSIQRVFVILDDNGIPVLKTPLFIDSDQDDESIKKSLTEWFSKYTDFDYLVARELSLFDLACDFPFYKAIDANAIEIYCDPDIRAHEKELIREKMKYENYRNHAVEIYEKYLKRKEIKKKWQKKK